MLLCRSIQSISLSLRHSTQLSTRNMNCRRIHTLTTPNGDPRLKELVHTISPQQRIPDLSTLKSQIDRPFDITVAIIGFPSDLGTLRNGGREGGASGPSHFRQFLKTKGPIVNPEYGVDLSNVLILDCGDSFEYNLSEVDDGRLKLSPFEKGSCCSDEVMPRIPIVSANTPRVAFSLEMAHQLHAARVKEALEHGYYVFSIGGSNDQSFPNALALIEHVGALRTSVVNIDAHLDVRPLVNLPPVDPSLPHTQSYSPLPPLSTPLGAGAAHSGSPFRQLLMYPGFSGTRFAEFACQGDQCSAAHASYALDMGAQLHWLSSIRRTGQSDAATPFRTLLSNLAGKDNHVFVSFDIDAVAGADAPGVSCPACVGLSAQEALDMSYIAGREPTVRIFDLSELCPRIEGYRTPMLAAFMFYHWIMGIASRSNHAVNTLPVRQ